MRLRSSLLLLAGLLPGLALAQSAALAAPPAPSVAPAVAPSAVETSVVKIFSTIRAPDVSRPWAKASPAEATGSGVVVEGRRILTNAHVVLYASQVQVQANQSGDKLAATVHTDPVTGAVSTPDEDREAFAARLSSAGGGVNCIATWPPRRSGSFGVSSRARPPSSRSSSHSR